MTRTRQQSKLTPQLKKELDALSPQQSKSLLLGITLLLQTVMKIADDSRDSHS